ncbi:MAG: hypothetical protein ACREAA_12405 [Candidatus Polarisedimenticolia bacterium]
MPRPVHHLHARRAPAARRHRAGAQRPADRASQRLAALGRSSPHPMLELDKEGRVTCHNAAARPIVEAFAETQDRGTLQTELAGIVSRCLEGGVVESRLRTSIGGRSYMWTLVPLPGQGVVHAFPVDVSREEALSSRMRKTDQLRSLGRLAGGMARSLNNHLTAIGFAGDALDKSLRDGSPLRAHVEEIRQAAERATELTTRLASFGRPREPRPRLLEPSVMLEELTSLLKPLLPLRLRLTTRVHASGAQVWADPTAIRQVLLTLILDARDVISGEGEIHLEIEPVQFGDRGAVRHIGLRAGRYVAMTVSGDDGAPLSPARAARLASLHAVVKKHGGDMWVHSTVETTRCTVYLPQAPRRSGATRPHETLLVVEGDPRIREAVRSTLQQQGYRVIGASSSARAVREATARRRPIHLLVADLSTCGGSDLIGPVRAAHPEARVLFLAGAAVPATDTPILEKPFSPARLAAAVREVLDTP